MLRATWRRPGSPAWLAIGMVFILPALAEAQLFPNRPIKRQREACAAEPPFYSQVRRDYYGYFPTCWSRFPAGWACPCPNPELPNSKQAFIDRPRDPQRDPGLGDPGLGPEGDDGAMPSDAPPPNDTNLPPVPNPGGRSPFDMDNTPDTPPPLNPTAPSPRVPNSNIPGRPGVNPSVPPGNRVPPNTSLLEMPALPSPTVSASADSGLVPGAMALAPDATLASNTSGSRPELGPLPNAAPPNPSVSVPGEPEPVLGVPSPAQAPQRRTILGGLFGSGNRRKR